MKPINLKLLLVACSLLGGLVGYSFGKKEVRPGVAAALGAKPPEISPLSEALPGENAEAASLNWRSLDQHDLASAADLLRKAGVPGQIVHDIVRGRAEREVLEGRAAKLAAAEPLAYWKAGRTHTENLQQELDAILRNPIRKEIAQRMEGAIGAGSPHDPAGALERALLGSKYPFLSPGQRETVEEARRDFHERVASLSLSQPPEPGELAAMETMREQFEKHLAQVFTPEEKSAYALRYSEAAMRLRYDLAEFAPSEQEFQVLHGVQSDYDAELKRLNSATLASDTGSEARRAAREKFDEENLRVLGAERYGEFTRARDPYYKMLASFTARQKIQPAVASEVYNLRQGLEEQVIAYMGSDLVAGEEKKAAMRHFKGQMQERLVQLMGAPLTAEFKKHPAGAWVEQIYVEGHSNAHAN